MNPLQQPHRNRIVALLACGWVLCVIIAILSHWQVFARFGVLLLVAAIVFFMISILYAMIGDGKPKDEKKPQSDQ